MRLIHKISEHVSYDEATYSTTAMKRGIDNTPGDEELASMTCVALRVFEPLREYFGVPIGITSFYRSKALNLAVGGSRTSSHIRGEAMDLDGDLYRSVTNRELFNYIKDNLEFDQLIWEFGTDDEPAWVHVSYSSLNNRGEVLRAYKENRRTKYKFI